MKATRDNLFTDGARGSTRNMTISKRQSGEFIISARRGKATKKPTAKQAAQQERFKTGIIYGRAVLKDAAKKALYEAAAGPDMHAYTLAVQDAVTPPKVVSITATGYSGKVGETIVVRATDDFRVAGVQVVIAGADGSQLEQGAAVLQSNGLDWWYTTTQANATLTGTKISATATDLPGNTGSLEVTL